MILASSLSLAVGAVGAEPLLSVPGPLSRSREGWTFVPSNPDANGATFNEFEGFYPDKGGKLQSPRIPLADKAEGTGAYYRLSFSAFAPIVTAISSYMPPTFFQSLALIVPSLLVAAGASTV